MATTEYEGSGIDDGDAWCRARVGQRVGGKYELTRLIGAGGMGAVYEAHNAWTGRRVAIKVMRPEVSAHGEAVQRFMQEARTTTSIAHPNIVDVLDMGQEPDGAFFLVQEFLTGADLRHHLDRVGRLAPREAAEILVPVMGALAAAHRRGIVHRDIKPENIFLAQTDAGELVPKLIDFGISKVSDRNEALARTRTGVAIGTPYYMAPEQARGDSSVDARADVWSIGVVWHEALAGERPIEAENYNVLIARLLTQEPPSLAVSWPDAPKRVVAVVDGALRANREARYADMRAFVTAVLACPDLVPPATQSEFLQRHRRALPDLRDSTGGFTALTSAGAAATITSVGADAAADALAQTLAPASPAAPQPVRAEPAAATDKPVDTELGWGRPSLATGAMRAATPRRRLVWGVAAVAVAGLGAAAITLRPGASTVSPPAVAPVGSRAASTPVVPVPAAITPPPPAVPSTPVVPTVAVPTAEPSVDAGVAAPSVTGVPRVGAIGARHTPRAGDAGHASGGALRPATTFTERPPAVAPAQRTEPPRGGSPPRTREDYP